MCDKLNSINLCDCGNATYIKTLEKEITVDGESVKKIVKLEYCKACGKEYESETNSEHCVLTINYDIDMINKKSLINRYTVDDVTLPKAQGIKCPNDECPNSNKKLQNIIYLTHNEANMSFTYICVDCHKNGIEPNIW